MKTAALCCLVIIVISTMLAADLFFIIRIIEQEEYFNLEELNKYEGNIALDVTVKGLMSDHLNFYIFGPLNILINNFLNLDEIQKISSLESTINVTNLISITHCIIAIVAGFFIASKKSNFRRIGVALFEIRTLMDNLGKFLKIRYFSLNAMVFNFTTLFS